MFPLKNLNTASVCFSFLACGFVAHLHSQEPPTEALEPAAAKEVLLGELSEQTEPPGPETVKRPLKEFFVSPKQEADYAFDPASMRFAARAKQGDRWVLVVDGKEQGTIDRIESILISPGGRHVIYSAKRAGQWVKMLDDKEAGPAFDKMSGGFWVFREGDVARHAYVGKRNKKLLMVVDGKEGPEFEDVRPPRFSPDGQRLAYQEISQRTETGERWLMVVDGEKGPEFEEVGPPVFSPDSHHVAYRGKRNGNREVLLLDGKELIESRYSGNKVGDSFSPVEFDYLGQPVFSPDGQHLAYRIRRDKRCELVIADGKGGPEFEWVGRPVFSPDGQHLAYRVGHDKKTEAVVVDGKEGPEYEEVGSFDFSPDSQQLAYSAKRDKRWRMVVGGQEGPEFGHAVFYGPVFSDDCVHSAYIALDASGGGYKVIEVHDGKTATELKLRLHGLGATYPFVEGAILSPDAQKLAYIVAAGGQAFFAAKTARAHRRIIVTGQEGEDYDALEISLGFSSDGRHLVYSVRGGVGSNKSSVVVDGKAGKLYDDVIGWTLVKDSSGGTGVAYIAREGRKFYRVFQPLA